MEKDYFRYYKPKGLITIIIILSFIYGYFLDFLASNINNMSIMEKPYVFFPSASSLIILTLIFIDRYGLKIPVIKQLFWIKDISGRYKGTINYKHFNTGIEETKYCYLEIEQSVSKISIKTYFDFKYQKKSEKTSSKSLVTSIINDDEFDNQKIIFTYLNKGNSLQGIPPSYGTNILSIIERENELFLEGNYYTDKEPQTKGEMKVKLISKKLKKEF